MHLDGFAMFPTNYLCHLQRSSANTVYFNEDMQEAQCAVEEALREYYGLLSELSVEQTQTVVAAIGLKMEELKAQLVAIREELDSS